jgi:glucosamine-6-phosphate deaminase
VSVEVLADSAEIGSALAAEILELYTQRGGSRFLLGCPGGRSLRTTYAALAASGADLRDLVVVMMDEYVVEGALPAADAHYSCAGFAQREIAGPLGVPAEHVWLPDPAEPEAYDARIAEAGGVDLFLLASGASDGHVAFLPPHSPRDGKTAVIELAESTRRDNVATFPEFRSFEEVPRHGVSVGVGTILAARRLRLVLHGAGKRDAVGRLLALDDFDPAWPASLVYAHTDSRILVDKEALP